MTKFKAPLLSLLALSCAVHAGEARPIDVPAGDLTAALEMIAKQSGVELLYHSDELKGIRTKGVKGALSAKEALERLLEGTLLTLSTDGETGAMVVSGKETATKTSQAMTQGATVQLASAELRLSQAHNSSSTAESLRTADARDLELGDIASGKGIPEILVKGKRSLNVDIKRTEDDPQPYVVLDRSQIERSGATTLEQFLQQRLPMNTSVGSVGGAMNMTSQDLPGASGINLRGLGDAQTLILIDGHRMSSPMTGSGNLAQGEISGIPLAAIERIEILPSTASGIYGGSATGGVINIITRKDYSGGEARLTYDNTFDADSAVRKLDVLFGTNFNEGKTNLLLSGSYSEANELLQGDRDFAARGRALISRNNSVYSNRPLGSTPNIRSSDGSLLVLDSGTALGSSFTSVPVGYAGVSTDGGAALAQNAGSYNWALSSGALGLRQSLYSEPSVKSGLLVLRHQFSDTLQAFIDLSSSEARRRSTLGGFAQNFTLAANSPFNPFTTAVSVTAAMPADIPQESLTERERAVVGVVKQLPGSWSTSLDFTFDRTEFSYNGGGNTGYGVVASAGGVDILRDLEAFPVDYQSTIVPVYAASTRTTMKDTNLRVSGPLGDLPGGRPMLSGALAYREESVPDTLKASSPTFHLLIPSRSTAVPSAYLEYRVPLFSQKNARPGLKELDLQFAVRGEKYTSKSGGLVPLFGALPSPLPQPTRETNEFSSVDPTIALRWVPVQDLAVRLSYGTGTLPPSLSQLVPIGSAQTGLLYTASRDPRRGNTPTGQFTGLFNGNPDLEPEKSKSWSAGLIFTPSALPNLRLSLDYTRIQKIDNIGTIPNFVQGVIDNEALFPGRVVRGPNLSTDPVGWAGPITHVDATPLNLASAELKAWDVQIDYQLNTQQRGAFDLFLVGTYQPTYALQLMSGLPMVDYAGISSAYPLELKLNGGVNWTLAAWRAGWNVSYFDSYKVSTDATTIANQGGDGKVDSQIYHDAFVTYDVGLARGNVNSWLAGTQVQLGVRNVFNKKAPFDASNTMAYYSLFGNPRMASYYLTVTTKF